MRPRDLLMLEVGERAVWHSETEPRDERWWNNLWGTVRSVRAATRQHQHRHRVTRYRL